MTTDNARDRSLPKYKILDGHKRTKKKLIPPIVGIPQTNFVSTIDTIVPEIIWIGILLDHYGTRDGINIAAKFMQSLWEIDKKINWYRFSEICNNSSMVAEAIDDEVLREVELPFYIFSQVYPWPDVKWASGVETLEEAQVRVEQTVQNYSNRFEQPYLTILSVVIYAMGLSDKMKFAHETLPNIEAIVNDWGTDEAEMASCSIRAMSLAFFPMDMTDQSLDWCKCFWRTNYQISGCVL
ncbi:hypothetical protein VCJ71_00965 [Alteriqipengyuania sp. WL0013]|uniref:hypothetical protein n=1 Tax=Alteriqipengyuania sp. WL0013 TaxID=3110773 RepID=UPI002CFCEC28|nr:hypothetical protein [Alteriqipengyuania sp. WL0013]MEB3414627.1 hypothetical protein [Alteriqipengyuania sp. WL0013]